MSTPRPMRSDASRNHEAILTAAIGVLAEHRGASMREIADASGTGRTTLYRHFPDRQALVAAIYDRVYAEAEAAVGRAAARIPGAGAVDVLSDLAAELAGYGDRYRFLEDHAADAPPDGSRPADGGPLTELIADGQHRTEIRTDLDARWLTDALVAVITRASSRRWTSASARTEAVRATARSLLAAPPPDGRPT